MSRLSDHTFTSSAPVFGEDDSFDPFFEMAERAATPPYSLCGESPVFAPLGRTPAVSIQGAQDER